MRVRLSLLYIFALAIFVSCEETGYNHVDYSQQKHWSERNKNFYKSNEAKERYGDGNEIEEARNFTQDPIGWAQDLGKPPGTFGEQCGAPHIPVENNPDVDGIGLGETLTEEEKKRILENVGPRPDFSRAVETPIDQISFGSEEMKEKGFYQYYPSTNARKQDRRFGTARTVWRVKAAAQVLKEKGIVMAVGDISKRGGVGTGGHKSHKKGVDVDLRLVAPDGMGARCSHYSNSCSDSKKTAEMIKAMIAVDPQNVRTVLINDPAVQRDVNEYSRSLGLGNLAQSCGGHDNHVHVSYKN